MERNKHKEQWLSWAVELQALAQSALAYCKDIYDIERFERIRQIAAEILAQQAELPPEKARELFLCEKGYQTPKIDTRAAVFREGKLLLVQERDGRWCLPGGWCEVGLSAAENTVKEVREEAGLDVRAERLIAVLDRARHNQPPSIYGICKIFVLCTELGGAFEENNETLAADFFALDGLPPISEDKTSIAQLEMCFRAAADENWQPLFD